MRGLRLALLVDAFLLFALGAALIFAPHQIARAFHFTNLPAGVGYMLGLWGCALVTMAAGYLVAATDPIGHVIWIQIGIARGAIEVLLGLTYVLRGILSFEQVAFGIFAAAIVTISYVVLYPNRTRTITVAVENASK